MNELSTSQELEYTVKLTKTNSIVWINSIALLVISRINEEYGWDLELIEKHETAIYIRKAGRMDVVVNLQKHGHRTNNNLARLMPWMKDEKLMMTEKNLSFSFVTSQLLGHILK